MPPSDDRHEARVRRGAAVFNTNPSTEFHMNPKRGIVYLVGAGPGDAHLLTLRGARVLAMADVVVYDHLANPLLLDMAPSALHIRAGKWIGRCTLRQDEINEALLEHAKAGKTVVRLKGGDPLVFGRGAEEAEFLRAHGVPFEFVPGVTAGVGVTAYAGIPLTLRGVSSAVAFVTGHQDPLSLARDDRSKIDWSALAKFPGTLVFYMGVTHLESIRQTLIGEGKSPETPAAVIESGTLPTQRVIVGSLADIVERSREANARPPALLVVGEVVKQHEALSWFETRRALFGQRIVITRPRDESLVAAHSLEELGAEVLIAPMVEIHPPDDFGPLDDAIDRIADYDWVVFASPNGVRSFMDRLLFDRDEDIRALGKAKLAAIGPSTAEVLLEYHLKADLIPPSYRSESLAESLAKAAADSRILLARADRGRTILQDELSRVAQVDQVTVYRSIDAEAIDESVAERIEEGSVDWITLSSPAIARRLHALLSEKARAQVGRAVKLATISPVTTKAATALGWEVAVEASDHSWDGLVRALLARISSEREG